MTNQADQWVSIPEAAQRLGLGIITVRRRIRDGTLEAELQPGRRGPEYRVRLPSEDPQSSLEPSVKSSHESNLEQANQVADLSMLMNKLVDRLGTLEESLVQETRSAALWEARTEASQANELRLERQVADQQREYERRVVELEQELERARRPWWKRLLPSKE